MNNYSAWDIKEEDFPKNGTINEQIQFILGYAILAASTFNSQPWKCNVFSDKVEIYLDKKRVTKTSDKTGRFAYLSIGCFIENLVVAAEHFMLATTILYAFKNKDNLVLIATVTFKKTKAEQKSSLFNEITKRATNRSLSQKKEISQSILKEIAKSTKKDFNIIIIQKELKPQLLSISQKADIAIWSQIEFRKEHVLWVRNNLTKKFDGMPAFGVGIGLIPSFLAKPIILSPIFPKIQAKKNLNALQSSNYFVAVCSSSNVKDWVLVGRFFEKISLYLTRFGICVSPMGQFIENENAQQELFNITKKDSKQLPQLFFRMGYPSKEVKHSPRIPVTDILL